MSGSVESYSYAFHKAIVDYCYAECSDEEFLVLRACAEIGFTLNAILAAIETLIRFTLVVPCAFIGGMVVGAYYLCGPDSDQAVKQFLDALKFLVDGGVDAAYICRDSLCFMVDNVWLSDPTRGGIYHYFHP